MRTLDILVAVLLVIGGLNWGLIAFANFDLVAFIFGMGFGETSSFSKLIYGLVGVSAIYQAVFLKDIQSRWGVC
jgi:uncharacterized membrane protein YuzA (DUF378 family)